MSTWSPKLYIDIGINLSMSKGTSKPNIDRGINRSTLNYELVEV